MMSKKVKHPTNRHDRMLVNEKKIDKSKRKTSPKRIVKEEIYDKETHDALQKARAGDLLTEC